MLQNVQISFFLTVLTIGLFWSCRSESETSGERDYEAEYFADYEPSPQKWGFINTAGQVVIPLKYDQVSGFSEGLAPVNFEGRWGYIDTAGNVVIPFAFRSAWQFRQGFARVIDYDGTPCFLTKSGRQVCPADATEISDFSEGKAVIQKGQFYSYADTSGKAAFDGEYEQAWSFENGFARIMLHGKQGLINAMGQYIIRPEFDKVSMPASGRILIRQGAESYFVNLQGDRAGKKYQQATSYVNDVAAVEDAEGWMLIGLDEQPLTLQRYAHIRPAGNGRWIAKQVDHLGILDANGAPLTGFIYAQINNFSEGYACYLRDELWGFLDTTGREITPPQYGLAWDFHEGLARAAFQDGIAWIDTSAQIPFIPEWFEIRDFSEGLAPVQE